MRERKGLITYLKKTMTGNFLNLEKEMDIQVWEVQRVPNKMNLKRLTPRHITIKMSKAKDKEIILKAVREKCWINQH